MRKTIITAAAVGGLLLTAGCGSDGGDDKPDAAPAATATQAAASQEIDWWYIKNEYATLLANTDCGKGQSAGVCNGLRNADMKSLQVDAKELPPSKDKTTFVRTIDDWLATYEEYSDAMCLGSLNTGQFDCVIHEVPMNTSIVLLQTLANKTFH